MSKKKTFSELSPDERAERVRRLMSEGHTNKSAAKELGTTPGTVAGIRHRKKIPTVRSAPLLVGGVSTRPAMVKLAVSEREQCQHLNENNHRCAAIREDDSPFCVRHITKR